MKNPALIPAVVCFGGIMIAGLMEIFLAVRHHLRDRRIQRNAELAGPPNRWRGPVRIVLKSNEKEAGKWPN